MLETTGSHGYKHKESHKRKHMSVPSSPSGVIEASFGYDTSNDSWPLALSVSSSPETRFKKIRAHDQQMRLPSINRVSVDVLTSPRWSFSFPCCQLSNMVLFTISLLYYYWSICFWYALFLLLLLISPFWPNLWNCVTKKIRTLHFILYSWC